MCKTHIKASGHVAEVSNKGYKEARNLSSHAHHARKGAKNGEATPEYVMVSFSFARVIPT